MKTRPRPISILLVEDHLRVGLAITRFLEERGHFQVSAIAQTGEEALEKLSHLSVDLVLIDVNLPKMSGIDLVIVLQKKYPDLPCLMLSGHTASSYVARSLRVGAKGYVLKGNSAAILEGIERVLNGEVYLSEELNYPT